MGQRRPILDHQHPLAAYRRRVLDKDGGGSLYHDGPRVDRVNVLPHLGHSLGAGSVHLVDDHDVRRAQVGLPRVIAQFVAGPVRVRHDDVQVGPVKGQVIVPPVPDDHVRFLLRLAQDALIVHSGVDHHAPVNVRLVLLPLLDGTLVASQVLVGGEPLHRLGNQVAVGHRVADHDHLLTLILEHVADVAGGLALAGAGAHGTDGHHRLAALQHRRVHSHQPKVGPGCQHLRRLVHHVLVGHVRVGEDHLVHLVLAD